MTDPVRERLLTPLPATGCPLCGGPNGCAPAVSGSFDSPCWCTTVQIPAEVLAHAFEPYFTTKANGQGSGMGLTIVYRLVSNLQGKIWAESEVGKGTVFHLLIPLIQ